MRYARLFRVRRWARLLSQENDLRLPGGLANPHAGRRSAGCRSPGCPCKVQPESESLDSSLSRFAFLRLLPCRCAPCRYCRQSRKPSRLRRLVARLPVIGAALRLRLAPRLSKFASSPTRVWHPDFLSGGRPVGSGSKAPAPDRLSAGRAHPCRSMWTLPARIATPYFRWILHLERRLS